MRCAACTRLRPRGEYGGIRVAHLRILASVPIPKFASLCSTFVCDLRNQRDTSNSMILLRSLGLKFLNKRAAIMIGTSNPPH
jgi:hypothetical protein